MATATMEFERPIADLERQIEELKKTAGEQSLDVAIELAPLEKKLVEMRADIYRMLTPLQRVQVARSNRRPLTDDYLRLCFTDFIELHGDRAFREDAAIMGGWARLEDETVMVIGHQRGRDTKENLKRNFGMAHPEGYRKALRLMKLAEKFHVPVITFIDTPGAWAGLGAEERGQSEAIARNLFEMSRLETPIIATVIGEGGSGGALALGVADRVNMLENSVYSVITVEGCAAILWKDGKSPEMRERAATALRITAPDLFELKIIDEIISEPPGGAHADHAATAAAVQATLCKQLDDLRRLKPDKLVRRRREKFMRMGQFLELTVPLLIEIAFKGNRKEFFSWPSDEPPARRTAVIVDADRGEDLGHVHAVGEEAERRSARVPHGLFGEAPPRAVKRVASADDLRRHDELRESDDEARRKGMERVRANALVMKMTDAEWQWDRKKLTFFFTAEKRVDFRTLVRELASMFRTRIELKQIGVRDEAKRLDGIGRCGRQYCSASWLPELRPVNLGVAKDQRLSLNPSQISGACGRLMCCLRYEHEFYVQSRRKYPKEGKPLRTSKGEEKVIATDIFRERVTLRGVEGDIRTLALAELRDEMVTAGDPTAAALQAAAIAAPPAPPTADPADESEVHEHDDLATEEHPVAIESRASLDAEELTVTGERRAQRRRGRRGGRRNRPSGGSAAPTDSGDGGDGPSEETK